MLARNSDFDLLASSAASRAIVFFWSESRREKTILLIFVLSESISPEASTVTNELKSPSVAAAEICANARTWLVRLVAIVLTFEVISCHTPSTFSTRAVTPRLPFVPTSRATRVTSDAKWARRSTMSLMVCARRRTSPSAWISTLRVRSPRATAVVAAAIERTWLVRLLAMRFTFSTSDFHSPETLITYAWPPSLPSMPTSFATRVTSAANMRSESTMVLTVRLRSKISPETSTSIFLDRSPSATARVTAAIERTCDVRFSAILLTLLVSVAHSPWTPSTCALPPSLPCVPTSSATRVTSAAKRRSCATMSLTVSLSSRISPRAVMLTVLDRSPCATAVVTEAISRTCSVMLDAILLTLSVSSFQVPSTPRTMALPPSWPSVPTSSETRVTSDEKTRRL